MGTPPKGSGDVGRRRRGPGRIHVQVAEGVEAGLVDGRHRSVEGLDGAEGSGPERVDEGAGITEPRLIDHGRGR